MDKAQAWFFTH